MTVFGEGNQGRWLHAFTDSTADIGTLSQCMVLVANEGGHRLIIADFKLMSNGKPRLKVYGGTSLLCELPLPCTPSSIVSFAVDRTQPFVPGIGVACGADILVFRNNKPYYKFSLPTLPILPDEQDIWRRLNDAHPDDVPKLVKALQELPYEELTARSQTLVCVEPNEWLQFIFQYSEVSLQRKTTITCMATMYRKEEGPEAHSCIVVGTETGDVMMIDPQGFIILHQARVSPTNSTPVSISCTGQYDIDFRCIVACRENEICILKRGWLEGRVLVTLTEGVLVTHVVIPGELSIVIANDNKTLMCYSKKGKRMWRTALPSDVIAMTTINLQHLSCTLVAVALRGGVIHLYRGRSHVDTILSQNTISAFIFGPLGQEEHVFALITVDGSLIVKILKRTADFSISLTDDSSTGSENTVKNLPIPKKNKLFVEQSTRERHSAIEMHQVFQQELCRLRLLAVQNRVEFMKTNETTVAPIRLSAQVIGLGPIFTLKISVENMDPERSLNNLEIIFHANTATYLIPTPYIPMPSLVPGITYTFKTKIIEIQHSDMASAGETNVMQIAIPEPVKIFVVKAKQGQPVLASRIQLPMTDMTMY